MALDIISLSIGCLTTIREDEIVLRADSPGVDEGQLRRLFDARCLHRLIRSGEGRFPAAPDSSPRTARSVPAESVDRNDLDENRGLKGTL